MAKKTVESRAGMVWSGFHENWDGEWTVAPPFYVTRHKIQYEIKDEFVGLHISE